MGRANELMRMRSRSCIDRRALVHLRRQGGRQLLTDIIAMFCEDAPERLRAARLSALAEDFDGAQRAAHMLKASAAALGATRVRMLSARIERLASRHDGPAVRALIGAWERSIATALRDLAAVAGGNKR